MEAEKRMAGAACPLAADAFIYCYPPEDTGTARKWLSRKPGLWTAIRARTRALADAHRKHTSLLGSTRHS